MNAGFMIWGVGNLGFRVAVPGYRVQSLSSGFVKLRV